MTARRHPRDIVSRRSGAAVRPAALATSLSIMADGGDSGSGTRTARHHAGTTRKEGHARQLHGRTPCPFQSARGVRGPAVMVLREGDVDSGERLPGAVKSRAVDENQIIRSPLIVLIVVQNRFDGHSRIQALTALSREC